MLFKVQKYQKAVTKQRALTIINYFWKVGFHKIWKHTLPMNVQKYQLIQDNFFLNCLAAKAEGNITINLVHLEQVTAKIRKLNNNTGIQTKISDFHESITFTELKIHEFDRACVKAFAEVLSSKLLSQESAVVNTRYLAYLGILKVL
ncbi:hypothetical protein C1646_759206 [Rhizophagus diaphanus]|nr:hypothetical protein C1646_759206 [Rhizophagus diaphanus] [Rhizophagus sp. MUCL 43196]